MKIWIDLANSPHVLFFAPIVRELERRGHTVLLTARVLAQTTQLARAHGLEVAVVGVHGGHGTGSKATSILERSWALRNAVRQESIDLAVGHNSYAQAIAARLLGVGLVTLMDYEHTPANHLGFRLASRVILPEAIERHAVRRYGVTRAKYAPYPGFKEQVYLAGFQPDPSALSHLIGHDSESVVVVARPPADYAVYHRFANPLFTDWLERATSEPSVTVVALPRNDLQRSELADLGLRSVIVPDEAVPGPSLIHAADLVVSAGGTMNREAAILGVPAYSLFRGRTAAVDRKLRRLGRMTLISDENELGLIRLEKKPVPVQLQNPGLPETILDLILAGVSGDSDSGPR